MRLVEILALSRQEMQAMNIEELREAVKSASRISKQRVSNIRRFSGSSPATVGLTNAIGQIPNERTISNMTRNQLLHVFTEEHRFLNSQTSTVPGARTRFRNIIETSIRTEGLTDRQIANRITRRISALGGPRGVASMLELLDRIRELEPTLEFQIGTNPTRGNGFFGTFVESYLSEDFDELREDPVLFAERLSRRYEELIEDRFRQEERFEF